MKTTSYYPVLMTDDVAASADFYRSHFRFKALFASNWYVHLQSSEDKRVNLGLVQGHHETIPEAGRGRAFGLLINFEVKDVDAVYRRTPTPACRSSAAFATSLSASATLSRATRTAC